MNVLITGGAGFIGSHLADRLLQRGDRVTVIDNYATGRRDNLRGDARLSVVEGTIADRALVEHVFAGAAFDVVVHAAASYKEPENWEEDARTNVVGTANVVQVAQRAAVRRFIYYQTALCYGVQPLEQPITLDHPLRPGDSSYAISKTAGEHYVRLSGLDFVSFRLANAYGPRNLSGPLPTFYSRLTSDKPCFIADTRRDFIYVADLIDVTLLAIDGHGNGGIYHVSSGADFSIKELYDAAIEALGLRPSKDVEIRPRGADDAFTILLDPSRTRREFGWSVKTPLRLGVQAAIEWYQQFGITQTFTHLKQSG